MRSLSGKLTGRGSKGTIALAKPLPRARSHIEKGLTWQGFKKLAMRRARVKPGLSLRVGKSPRRRTRSGALDERRGAPWQS
eukprot:1827749-Pyramimonas_sp.AAC.1